MGLEPKIRPPAEVDPTDPFRMNPPPLKAERPDAAEVKRRQQEAQPPSQPEIKEMVVERRQEEGIGLPPKEATKVARLNPAEQPPAFFVRFGPGQDDQVPIFHSPDPERGWVQSIRVGNLERNPETWSGMVPFYVKSVNGDKITNEKGYIVLKQDGTVSHIHFRMMGDTKMRSYSVEDMQKIFAASRDMKPSLSEAEVVKQQKAFDTVTERVAAAVAAKKTAASYIFAESTTTTATGETVVQKKEHATPVAAFYSPDGVIMNSPEAATTNPATKAPVASALDEHQRVKGKKRGSDDEAWVDPKAGEGLFSKALAALPKDIPVQDQAKVYRAKKYGDGASESFEFFGQYGDWSPGIVHFDSAALPPQVLKAYNAAATAGGDEGLAVGEWLDVGDQKVLVESDGDVVFATGDKKYERWNAIEAIRTVREGKRATPTEDITLANTFSKSLSKFDNAEYNTVTGEFTLLSAKGTPGAASHPDYIQPADEKPLTREASWSRRADTFLQTVFNDGKPFEFKDGSGIPAAQNYSAFFKLEGSDFGGAISNWIQAHNYTEPGAWTSTAASKQKPEVIAALKEIPLGLSFGKMEPRVITSSDAKSAAYLFHVKHDVLGTEGLLFVPAAGLPDDVAKAYELAAKDNKSGGLTTGVKFKINDTTFATVLADGRVVFEAAGKKEAFSPLLANRTQRNARLDQFKTDKKPVTDTDKWLDIKDLKKEKYQFDVEYDDVVAKDYVRSELAQWRSATQELATILYNGGKPFEFPEASGLGATKTTMSGFFSINDQTAYVSAPEAYDYSGSVGVSTPLASYGESLANALKRIPSSGTSKPREVVLGEQRALVFFTEYGTVTTEPNKGDTRKGAIILDASPGNLPLDVEAAYNAARQSNGELKTGKVTDGIDKFMTLPVRSGATDQATKALVLDNGMIVLAYADGSTKMWNPKRAISSQRKYAKEAEPKITMREVYSTKVSMRGAEFDSKKGWGESPLATK